MIPAHFNIHELNLQNGEVLLSVMRKHWFVLFIHILPFGFVFFIPLIVLYFMSSSIMTPELVAILIFSSSLWMLVSLTIMFTIWTSYYLDLWIVTTKRIIDIEQKGLFNREIKTLHMKTVQDVQVDVVGIFETFLKFGTLRVQTAGTGGTDAKIIGIPKPGLERDLIMNQVNVIRSGTTVASP